MTDTDSNASDLKKVPMDYSLIDQITGFKLADWLIWSCYYKQVLSKRSSKRMDKSEFVEKFVNHDFDKSETNSDENEDQTVIKKEDNQIMYEFDNKYVNYIVNVGIYLGNKDYYNLKSGKAKMIYPNGDYYEGIFYNNTRHGNGHYIYLSQPKGEIDINIMQWLLEVLYNKYSNIINNHVKESIIIKQFNSVRGLTKILRKVLNIVYNYYNQQNSKEIELHHINPSILPKSYSSEFIYQIPEAIIRSIGANVHNIDLSSDIDMHSTICIPISNDISDTFKESINTGLTYPLGLSPIAIDTALTFGLGSYYHGSYYNGVREGEGVYRAPDGSVYKGQYRNNKRHGQGIYYYVNGDTFSGEWYEDNRQGYGTYIYYNSQYGSIQGQWRDKFCISGLWIMPNGSYYEGKFEYNAMNHMNVPLDKHSTFHFPAYNASINGKLIGSMPIHYPKESEETTEESNIEDKPKYKFKNVNPDNRFNIFQNYDHHNTLWKPYPYIHNNDDSECVWV